MEIQLSHDDIYFEENIRDVATSAGCYARIKWARARQVRFVLVERRMSTRAATSEQHDAVIAALLELDPKAKIRTARAIYNGRDDFKNQSAKITAS